MFRRPLNGGSVGRGQRGRASAQNRDSISNKGVYEGGTWLCACTPRVPAQRYQVKRDTPNRGRWFYGCRNSERCAFFAWEEDAKAREEASVQPNPEFKPSASSGTTSRKTDIDSTKAPDRSRYVTPPRDAEGNTKYGSVQKTKRSRQEFENDSPDEFALDLSPEETREFIRASDVHKNEPITPARAERSDPFKTPSRRRLPWQQAEPSNGLPTPNTGYTIKSAFEAAAARSAATDASPTPKYTDTISYPDISPRPALGSSFLSTPTPMRFLHKSPGDQEQEPDLVQEVTEVLKAENVHLSSTAHSKLAALLNRHSLRTQGFKRGRDVARASLKARETKIAELQNRICTLEAELEEKQVIITHLNWEKDIGHAS